MTSITDAKAHFSALIRRVEKGEEVTIGKAGKPVAKLVPVASESRERTPGALKGQIEIAEDFDELPEDLREAFGMAS